MTTNHPAPGHVSLDRLHQISEILSKAAVQSDGGNLGYAMADAVKVIDGAIASFGAEPVLYAMQGVKLDTDAISTCKNVVDGWVDEWNQERKPGVPEYKTVPLYTTPPAPVVPDEITHLQVSRAYGGEVRGYRDGWNACRVAMLRASNHTEQHLDMVDHSGYANKMVAGNSPVNPDGWIPVSEQMPEDEQEVIVQNKLGYRYVSYFDEHSGLFFDMPGGNQVNCIEHILVTHWMPLPAAPQQEVK